MEKDAPRRRRARPVADAPIDGLLTRTEDLTKGWMLALVEDAPLRFAPSVLSDTLAREGPRVCDAMLCALVADADLSLLQAGGDLRGLAGQVGEMAGARGPGETARAVDALHDVLWAALADELHRPEPALVGELSARLGLVCATVREAALEAAVLPVADEPALDDAPSDETPALDDLPLVDETPAFADVPSVDEPAPAPPEDPWGAPGPPTPGSLWMSALEDEVRRSDAGAAPLSLLLAELEDAERVVTSASPERADLVFGDFVAALRRALRRQDILVRETDARAWVIARETARAGAHSLGSRIAEAVGETSSLLSGAPLVASVGIAVLGEDGRTTGELIDAAEEARFAASARGIEVSRRVPDRDR